MICRCKWINHKGKAVRVHGCPRKLDRNENLIRDRMAGLSLNQLGRKYIISPQRVSQILRINAALEEGE